jgi:hypothetical protein
MCPREQHVFPKRYHLVMTGFPLEPFWDNEEVRNTDWEKGESSLVTAYQCGDFDPTLNGFTVSKASHFDRSTTVQYIMVPRLYKNGLRLLNAKLQYLQQCAKHLSLEIMKNEGPSEGLENLQSAKDCILKLIRFNARVRESIFEDIKATFYNRVSPNSRNQKPSKPFQDSYRCHLLDVWMYCEFSYGYQEPPTINNLLLGFKWEEGVRDVRDSGESLNVSSISSAQYYV